MTEKNLKKKKVRIEKLSVEMADDLSRILNSAPDGYSQYFIPFEFTKEAIVNILKKIKIDLYFAIFVDDDLAGFYMLRGFDSGYDIPSYGVWISSDYNGNGLASLSLYHAFAICKSNGIKKMMLKVHPDNLIAKRIYEKAGFKQTGIDEKIGHIIFHKEL